MGDKETGGEGVREASQESKASLTLNLSGDINTSNDNSAVNAASQIQDAAVTIFYTNNDMNSLKQLERDIKKIKSLAIQLVLNKNGIKVSSAEKVRDVMEGEESSEEEEEERERDGEAPEESHSTLKGVCVCVNESQAYYLPIGAEDTPTHRLLLRIFNDCEL